MNDQKKTTMKIKKVNPSRKKAIQWTKQNENLKRSLFNKFAKENPEAEYNTFLTKYKRQLLGFVNNLPLSDGSKKGFIFMIKKHLEQTNDRYFDSYKEEANRLYNIVENKERDNTQTDKEKENYRPLEYFKEFLANYNAQTSYEYLFLALLTLQPALRASFYSSAIFTNSLKNNDKISNYIVVDRQKKKCYYIVNNDKVSNTQGFQNGKNSIIEIEDDHLKDLLFYHYNDSLETGRQLIFETPQGTQMSALYMTRMLRRMLGFNTNVNMFRSAHINNLYHKKNVTANQRQKLAKQMRHSADAGLNYYYKTDLADINLLSDDEEEDNIKISQQLRICEDEKQSKIKKDNDKKIYDKKRYDVIYRLNKFGKQPLKSSIEKYNLKQDDQGQWI